MGKALSSTSGAVQTLGLAENDSREIAAAIGAVARCVEDQARIVLEMSGPQCLALALAKIEGRSGQVVDGVFVKSAVTV